jgi:RNase adaptor protein for sRNA GlmZ degradation
VASEKLQGLTSETAKSEKKLEKLIVRIFSFSFHKGLPQDDTGNGGGFVFDARSLPNPGREERFKSLTGKDALVIDYLDQQQSVHDFLASAESLVDASVTTYQSRSFKHLMVSFGCTGGQHRSVYLAEELAKHLREKEGVEVVVRHREQEQLNPAEAEFEATRSTTVVDHKADRKADHNADREVDRKLERKAMPE